jgi:hypothetical protein
MEAFSEAQLSAFAPMRHSSRNPYLRIANIGNGPVWANVEGVQDPFAVRSGVRHA